MAQTAWTEKLAQPQAPVVGPSVRVIDGHPAGTMSLVPTPRQLDDYIRGLPAGTHVDSFAMRRSLADLNGARVTCPAATARHLRTVAEAAYELIAGGMPVEQVTPFWRVLDTKTAARRSLSFSADFVRERRRAEGLPE